MIKDISIQMKVDDDNNVIEMAIEEGGYARIEYVYEGIDEPITLDEAIRGIREYFE